MSAREAMLGRIRAALGRAAGAQVPEPPPVRLEAAEGPIGERLDRFRAALERLGAGFHMVQSPAEAKAVVEGLTEGSPAVASNAPFLLECGVPSVRGVESGFRDTAALRRVCETAAFGITGADYLLADPGTIVLFSSLEEARLISLLPPVHIAVAPASRLLGSLDDLFLAVPDPAARSSAMVLITGPSRTGDIEQILVRGVHGPGTVHVVVVTDTPRSAS